MTTVLSWRSTEHAFSEKDILNLKDDLKHGEIIDLTPDKKRKVIVLKTTIDDLLKTKNASMSTFKKYIAKMNEEAILKTKICSQDDPYVLETKPYLVKAYFGPSAMLNTEWYQDKKPIDAEKSVRLEDRDILIFSDVTVNKEYKLGMFVSQLFELKKYKTMYYHLSGIKSDKIAAFDLDGTLIEPKSGKKFAQNSDDWMLIYDNTKEKLTKYIDDGFKIVIFTNQAGIAKGQTTIDEIEAKLQQIIASLGMPLEVYVATDKDSFRKPMTDAWDFMLEMNELKEVDKLSFYCGDAAGRAKGYIKGRNKDFNITDRYFASNIGIQFYTPEEIFLGMKPFPYIDDYLEHDDYLMKKAWPLPASLNDKEKNVIIMIGPQASGKSTLSKTLFEEYTYLNNDEIKSMPKLKRLYEASLKKKENVVVDNTNPTIEVRSYFINLAEEYGYKIYAYFFDFTKPLTMHMNQYRVQSTHGERRAIPDVAIHTYYKKLEEPSLDEGYTSLIRLKKVYNLKPDKTFARYYYYKYDV